MISLSKTCLGGLALALLAGCSGSGDGTGATRGGGGTNLTAQNATDYAFSFLMSERFPSVPYSAFSASSTCVALNTSSLGGGTTVTETFTNCTGSDGAVLNGQVVFTYVSSACDVTYTNLTAQKSGETWILNGTKHIALGSQQATITTGSGLGSVPMTLTHQVSGSSPVTRSYTCNLTSDWATPGIYKLWGTFSYQITGATTVSGSIDSTAPLTWAMGCCYPVAGYLDLTQGSNQATVSFSLPCGTVTVTPAGSTGTTATLPQICY